VPIIYIHERSPSEACRIAGWQPSRFMPTRNVALMFGEVIFRQ
jgi:hypothetical protein